MIVNVEITALVLTLSEIAAVARRDVHRLLIP
jgi:hypothetical protein